MVNAAEKAVKELSLSEEWFTTILLGQDHDTAATSCFHVYSSCKSCMDKFFLHNFTTVNFTTVHLGVIKSQLSESLMPK